MTGSGVREREGVSLIEVLVALLILTVGVLAMAATTGHVFTSLNDSGRRTERTYVVQQVVEELRSVPFAQISASLGTKKVGAYTVTTEAVSSTAQFFQVRVETVGPGYRPGEGGLVDVTDTTYITLSRGGA